MKVKEVSNLTTAQPRDGNASSAMRNRHQNTVSLAAAVVRMRSYTTVAMPVHLMRPRYNPYSFKLIYKKCAREILWFALL